jgi:predicted MPP superfamily phosphohydrolase
MHPLARAALGVTAAGVVGVGYASLVERNLFVLRRHTVPVLAPGSRSLRVLHLTDLHLMPTQERKIAWIQALAEVEPDLVVNTGDNIAHPESIGPLLRAFEPLLGVPGVFVLGSNDYFAPRLKNPALYLTRDHRRNLGKSLAAAADRPARGGVRVRRVDGADQPADAADGGRRRSGVRRGRRPAPGLRPV